ncbi:MAG TPA: AraC family transcriptional regulator, partial [Marmoricola sp.]|nr:AraC family transcriptional regulator [Marmoricola sp.]
MTLIRGSALLGYCELVSELGFDAVPLLARAHLRPEAVSSDGDHFIDYRSAVAALELGATATGTADFGRRLASRQGVEILGPVGVAARTAPTVGEALTAVDQYMSVYSPALSVTIDPQMDQPHARLDWRITADRAPSHRQSAELGVGVSLRIIRLLAGEDVMPVSVSFRHPPVAEVENYRAYFDCPVHFESLTNGFLFSRAVLARPLGSDGAVHEVIRDYLNSIVIPIDAHLEESVRLLVRHMLPTGGLGIDIVAAHLALHPRTLQRQLAARGSGFAELVDEVRRSEAE